MNRRSSPGLGQWLTVSIMVIGVLFLFYKLYEFSLFRSFMPSGLTIAGVDVGGMTHEQVEEVLTDRYVSAPVVIHHPSGNFELNPLDAEMRLDLAYMLSEADYQRDQQDFWSGFWGFLWDRPVEVEMVELAATHNRARLREVLEIVATQYDRPAEPPQPIPQSLSFQYGTAGMVTDIDASLQNVENALYRAIGREARLVVEASEPERPEQVLLARLLVNHVQSFDGVASIFVKDLRTGEEIAYQADVAMSGMELMRLPVALDAYRMISGAPTVSQTLLISDTLLATGDISGVNTLLNMIAGKEDPYDGADLVTRTLQQLGLENSFILGAYDAPPRRGIAAPETEANANLDETGVTASGFMQTTAEDIGALLTMIYECASQGGGALPLLYAEEITQAECQSLLQTMSRNEIGSLIEGGLPDDVPVAHRHGWINDTHADAGIVFSPGGDYVIVMLMYKPDWLEWELSSPLMADLSRATYNYFNFANPYLGGSGSN